MRDMKSPAQVLIAKSSSQRRMSVAPTSFSGTLEQLVDEYARQNLIDPAQVASFHELIVEYLDHPDPLFLIRAVKGTERGHTYRVASGSRFKATDNAPAWWIHFALYHGVNLRDGPFAAVIETLPSHFFEVASQTPQSINAAGWHVAHIFAVKDGRTEYRDWSTGELARRFVRNIHPCNYFFVPKTEWQKWGGDANVIAYFASLYQSLYRDTWKDFLALIDGKSTEGPPISGVRYHIAHATEGDDSVSDDGARVEKKDLEITEGCVVSYRANRLAFKADLIEPLAASERFRIITPNATFEMSRAEFYAAFPNVVKSKSYIEDRLYHYPHIPSAALKFQRKS